MPPDSRSAKDKKPILFLRGFFLLGELFVADVRKLLLIFAGAVAFVFLIACCKFCQPAAHPRSFPSARARSTGGFGRRPLAISASVAGGSTLLPWREVTRCSLINRRGASAVGAPAAGKDSRAGDVHLISGAGVHSGLSW